jgi:hypothetical protein
VLFLRLLLSAQTLGLDHIVLEHLHRLSHRPDLVGVVARRDVDRDIAAGEYGHGGGHGVDRTGDASDDKPG